MGSSPSKTNDGKDPVQVNVKPTRISQLGYKSTLQRPSSSLSTSSKASFSPFSVLPPVTNRNEVSVGRPTSGSRKGKTSQHKQSHVERSVYLPDARTPLPDIINSSMSNAGRRDTVKTTHQRSNNQGRPSLQPLDSLRLRRENGSRRYRRNRNGDFTQSGYGKDDLEIAVQASLAILEEQQSDGGEDIFSEYKPTELEIRTSEISERQHEQQGGDGLEEEDLDKMKEDNADFTLSGFNQWDLDMAMIESLDITQEKQHQQQGGEGLEQEDSDERHNDGYNFTKSGYVEEELKRATEKRLAASSGSGGGSFATASNQIQSDEENANVDSSNRKEDNADFTLSGFNQWDLDMAMIESLDITQEKQHQQQGGEGLEQEDSDERGSGGGSFATASNQIQSDEENANVDSSNSDQEKVGRGIMNEEQERDPSDFQSTIWYRGEERKDNVDDEEKEEGDEKNDDEGEEDYDLGISDQEEVGRGIMNEEQERDPSDFQSTIWYRDEDRKDNLGDEEKEEEDKENDEEGEEDCDLDISVDPGRPIEDILTEMRGNFNDYGYNTLCIRRSCVWESALEQFRQENFSPADGFNVNFVDEDGNTEGAIDAGGPKREYFQLMIDHLANCSLFEGPSGRKLLSYDVQANRRNEYFYAGMVIGQSLLYEGPVPRILSPLLLDCLILEPENVRGSREDIYDSDWLQLLDEVQKTDCIRDFVLNHNKTLHIAGCLRDEKMENRDQFIQDLINYYLVERTRPAFEKFKQGLDSVGVYQYILTYPDQFREVFSRREPLTAEKMSAMFAIDYSYIYSQEQEEEEEGETGEENGGNTVTEVERKTVEFWENYLRIVEVGGSQVNLEDIMMFTTGMKEQPYGQYPKIYFNHPYDGEPASKYPHSSTCSCALYLPLHETFEEFKEAMDFGILNGSQFGHV